MLCPASFSRIATNAPVCRMSVLTLRVNLVVAKILVWLATLRREGELAPEAHIYLFQLYSALADFHRSRGHNARALELSERGEQHRRLGGSDPDGPPYAAAMAMPRPKRWIVTDAVGRRGFDDDGSGSAA